jgi:acetylornithine/succinyldiaminopimelate/putrescine aminotransferase|tara:strand:+ start:4650 stop:5807 length:1158 start_codon:yes stop_codon:yes gene_type:complete
LTHYDINTLTEFEWSQAKDFRVYDKNGQDYIDLTSGIFVANAGHSNPKIIEAIQTQLDENLLFSYSYPTQIRRDVENLLLKLSPEFDQVCLMSSGSEATDTAFQMMLKWGALEKRDKIVSFTQSFHGRTVGSALVSGSMDSPITDECVQWLPFPYDENTEFDPNQIAVEPNEIAGIMIETYQGWGAWFYPDQYLKDLCAFAKEHGILICVDDIQAGFYRCGTLFGYQTYGDYLKPDLLCLGKGLTSSLPMSALLTKKELGPIPGGGTHGGNTLCCAAAKASMEFLTDPDFQKDYQERAAYFEQSVKSLESLKYVKQVNARGMIAGIIFNDSEAADAVVNHCLKNRVLPVHTGTTSIKLGPPLTISKDAIDTAIETIRNGEQCLTT